MKIIILLFNIILSNPNAWHDDPSGGSPMPIWMIVVGVILLFIMFKGSNR